MVRTLTAVVRTLTAVVRTLMAMVRTFILNFCTLNVPQCACDREVPRLEHCAMEDATNNIIATHKTSSAV